MLVAEEKRLGNKEKEIPVIFFGIPLSRNKLYFSDLKHSAAFTCEEVVTKKSKRSI